MPDSKITDQALAPLWQIEDDLQALLESVDGCPEELLPELEQRIAAYVAAEAQKVDRVAAVFSQLESVQSAAKTEIDRLRQRVQSAAGAADRLEKYIVRILRAREGKPLKGRTTTLSLRRSEALVITDPEAVPAAWKRITTVTDVPKDAVKKALKAGEMIPGVAIEQREHLVRK